MSDSNRDRYAEALADGTATLPTGGASDEVEREYAPRAPAQPKGGGKGKRRPKGAADRFAYPKGLVRWAKRLTPTQFALALALWNRQPVDRLTGALVPFRVGATTLGRDCRTARNHTSEAVQVLVGLGLVQITRFGNRARSESHEYLVPEIPPEPPEDDMG